MHYKAIALVIMIAALITPISFAQHWPSDGYYIKDPPQRALTDVDCSQVTDFIIKAKITSGGQTTEKLQVVAAGQPVTVDGDVGRSSNICAGYQYSCETYQEYTCEYKKHTFSQEMAYRNCAAGTTRIHAEGEYSETCFGCIIETVGRLAEIVLPMFGVPVNPATVELILKLAPAVDNPNCVDMSALQRIAANPTEYEKLKNITMFIAGKSAFDCNIIENNNMDCWSVCGKDYTSTVSASPTCGGGNVLSYKDLPYMCVSQSCGGYANKNVNIEVVHNGETLLQDTTATNSDGKFSYTFTAPDIDDMVSVVVSTSI
ncbi:MAG: hypothetical protein NT120_02405 [Candidatus Aenigmarchaeota archaeon]|nr:hypothetical protein [Candidatus Aenigmarchaeota archaeon]